MSAALMLRLSVEDFLYREAALLDDWNLKEWLALFSPSARYEIAPTGDPEAGTLLSKDALFLVADDRERLEQRVIRLQKPQAHAEYPHSRVRHIYSNVRILKDSGAQIEVKESDTHTIAYRGAYALWSVIRRTDSEVVKDKFPTAEDARVWMAGHLRALAG